MDIISHATCMPSKKKTMSSMYIVLIIHHACLFGETESRPWTIRGRLRQLFDSLIRVPDVEIKPMIIGGESSPKNAWPWMASLQFLDTFDGSYYHVCGASLISEEWLLTAAHCIDARVLNDPNRGNPANYRVMLGAINLYFPSDEAEFLSVRSFIMHEHWLPEPKEGFPNDIALVRLSERTTLDQNNIGTVELPMNQDEDFGESECWIVGWGLTEPSDVYPAEVLQQGMTPVVPNVECQQRMPLPILPSDICVGGTDFPRSCEADSGSPLSCRTRTGEPWVLAGIGSWSKVDCADYSVYTRVSDYVGWIKKNIG